MFKVESFNLDHTKVKAPYVRLASVKHNNGVAVSKFDIRMCQPNKEFMETGAIHAIEHIAAENLRVLLGDKIIDFSPMGCRTGFYLIVWGEELTETMIREAMIKVFEIVIASDSVPGAEEVSCGNYRDMDLPKAKIYSQRWIDHIEEGYY